MKRNGFTLSEVLIALAIVGIMAALTLPTLKANVQKKTIGPTFLKGIETLEVANRQLLQEQSAVDIHDFCENTNYMDCIDRYIEVSEAVDTPTYTQYDLKTPLTLTNYKSYLTKDGIAFITNGENKTFVGDPREPYRGTGYEIYIDVNGISKKPNALGYDTFLVYVDNIGSTIPYGGRLYKKYTKSSNVLWEASDTECKPNAEPKGDGKSCSGSIVDNNGQVLYK